MIDITWNNEQYQLSIIKEVYEAYTLIGYIVNASQLGFDTIYVPIEKVNLP